MKTPFTVPVLLLLSLRPQSAFSLPQSNHDGAGREIEVTPRASSGCGKSQFLPGVTQYRFNLKSSGKDRSYSFHLPSGYDKDKKYPVVVGFHGSSSIGAFFELDTKMSGGDYSSDVCIPSFILILRTDMEEFAETRQEDLLYT
jgi:hypothetical protein